MKNLILVIALALLIPTAAAGQGTGFSFQGRLNDGTTPANGSYDLQFSLYTAIVGGSVIGSAVSKPNTTLVNGVFSVMLDFGAAAFNDPNAVFIEISIKPNGSPNAFTILGPRQQLTVVPFAVRAANATNATSALTANFADFAGSAEVAGNANFLGGLQSTDFIRNSPSTVQPNSSLAISGQGLIGGNLIVYGTLLADGDIRQGGSRGGAVKAMARIQVTRSSFPDFPTASATVVSCFSGVATAGSPNCGITFGIVDTTDHVQINFGFPVTGRFISLTGFNDTVSFIGFPNSTTVEIDDTTTNRGSSQFFVYIF